jgi:hypothetical protein
MRRDVSTCTHVGLARRMLEWCSLRFLKLTRGWQHLYEVDVLGIACIAAQLCILALLHPRWQRLVCSDVVYFDAICLLHLDHHAASSIAVLACVKRNTSMAVAHDVGRLQAHVFIHYRHRKACVSTVS